MSESILNYSFTPGVAEKLMYPEIFDNVHVRNPKVYYNEVLTTPSTKAEIRSLFANTLDGRVGEVIIVCEASPNQGEYLKIKTTEKWYGVWMDTTGDGSTGKPTDPDIAAGDMLAADISGGATATQVATAVAAALDGNAAFSAVSSTQYVHVMGADVTTNAIADAEDGDLGWSGDGTWNGIQATVGGVHVLLYQSAADDVTVTILGIDENGDEVAISQDLAAGVATESHLVGPFRRINGMIRTTTASVTVTASRALDISTPYAQIASGDRNTLNARWYIPENRTAFIYGACNIIDNTDTSAPVRQTNAGIIWIERSDDLGIAARAVQVGNSLSEVRYCTVQGSETAYVTLHTAEADTDATEFKIYLQQVIITVDS